MECRKHLGLPSPCLFLTLAVGRRAKCKTAGIGSPSFFLNYLPNLECLSPPLLEEMASPPPAPQSSLLHSTHPTLHLAEATPEEKTQTWSLNGQSWRGALSLPLYLDREHHLAAQSLTRHGGIRYWVLTNKPSAHDERRIVLSTCESLQKRALVATKHGEVEEVISYGIGSVFCRNEYRGRGYANRMMKELGRTLEVWGQNSGKKTNFTVLYSDIGKVRILP